MAVRGRKIIVAGDVTIDWLAVVVPAVDVVPGTGQTLLNWQLRPGTWMVARPGGALLLARMVGAATGGPVITHRLREVPLE